MTDTMTAVRAGAAPKAFDPKAKNWNELLAPYRRSSVARSVWEIIITVGGFMAWWAAACAALSVSYILAAALIVPTALFLVRIFLIQHDCGHGSFFRKRLPNDWTGRALGVLTFTPYDVWRRDHAIHHATSGNLDHRGIGDIDTLTVKEYLALPRWRRFVYHIYRHPFIMFGIGPSYLFLLQHRLPIGMMRAGWQPWVTTMGTNLGIAAIAALMMALIGWKAFLVIQIPTVMLAASIGVWLFYVQHQFEDTFWAKEEQWSLPEAALHGASHYDLPPVLQWMTANIGLHHVHHLASRIPYYRLPEVLRDHPELEGVRRVTMLESIACVKLRLWDEGQRRLVSFREARAMSASGAVAA